MRARYEQWIRLALEEARTAPPHGDVPVGAVVVGGEGSVVGRGANARERTSDPTAHAEVLALRQASTSLRSWRLTGCSLVVTLEPCAMCAGAATLSRVDRVIFGAWNLESGAAGSVWDLLRDRRLNHRPEVVGGVLEAECSDLLSDWFTRQRAAGEGAGEGDARV